MPSYMRKIEKNEHPKIKALYSYMSAAQIAGRYQVTAQAILNILKKMGVTPRPHTKPPKKVPRK